MDWNGIDSRRAGDHPAVMRRSKLTMNASKRRIEMSERNAKRQASQAYYYSTTVLHAAGCMLYAPEPSFMLYSSKQQASTAAVSVGSVITSSSLGVLGVFRLFFFFLPPFVALKSA